MPVPGFLKARCLRSMLVPAGIATPVTTDFSNVFLVLSGERRPSLEATRDGGAAVLAVGKFINAIIKFVIVAMAIFWLLKVINRFHQKEEATPKGPTPTEALLAEIRDELKAQPRLP